MAENKKISDLPEELSVSIADYVAIVVPGTTVTKKVKLANVLALGGSSGGGTPHFVGRFNNITDLRTSYPTGSDGDYAIVGGTPHSQQYIWDTGNSDWVLAINNPAVTFAALGGSATDNTSLANELQTRDASISTETTNRTNADTALQNQINNKADITYVNGQISGEVTARNTAISNEATDRSNADTLLQDQVSALSSALIPHPAYTTPIAGISSTQSTSGLEIGQTINIPLTTTFNQNDGGASTGLSIKKNGTQVATSSPYTDSLVVMSASAITYLVNYTYAQGPIKNNIIGVPDATGRIAVGNVNSAALNYQGFYRVWYDTVSALPTDSAGVRALTNTRFSNSGNTFTLNTGSTNTKFCIVLPPGKSLVSVIDQDALNLDITSSYTQSAITVNDAAGTAVPTYKIYATTQSVPYSSNHRHNITIA